LDKNLFDKLVPFRSKGEHLFVKLNDETKQPTYLSFKTDGPPLVLNQDNVDHFILLTEKQFEEKFIATDSTYYLSRLDYKLDFGFSNKFLKLKYFHHKKNKEWYMHMYLIYSNARTLGATIISPVKKYDDLEGYVKSLKVKRK